MLNSVRGGALGATMAKKFAAKNIRATVSLYEYVEDFRDNEPAIYSHLCSRQEFSKYCSDLKRRKKQNGYWTMERSLSVIPECETITILRKRYYRAYMMVKKAGLLAEYYKEKVKPKIKWTLVNCATAARYCDTKTEFRMKYRRAYERLRKEGLLDELIQEKQEKGKGKKKKARRQ
ncbi:MAG: hypothetical protein K5657_02730 [Desulfovibrio sp.]|nr:hypothetical protein [Desulfovibrio sp.]